MRHFLWLEGVDFDLHVFDTNDLSTIRGGSLALLAAPQAALTFLKGSFGTSGPAIVFAGASIGLIAFDATKDEAVLMREGLAEWLATTNPSHSAPFHVMRFVIGLAPADGEGEAAERRAIRFAQADARRRQAVGDYPRRALVSEKSACALGGVLPADTSIAMPTEQAVDYGVDDSSDGKTANVPASSSVSARRQYGRAQRQIFYNSRLDIAPEEKAAYKFTNSLHEIVAGAPAELPASLKTKIAVLYVDGNGFTKIRDTMGGDQQALTRFADAADTTMRRHILASLLQPYRETAVNPRSSDDLARYADKPGGSVPRLRFETLLFGGDEAAFVMPSWLAFEAVANLLQRLTGAGAPKVGAHPLRFACGLAIASYKTPIKLLKERAADLAGFCKSVDAGVHGDERRTRIAFQIYESVEAPLRGVTQVWDAALSANVGSASSERVVTSRNSLAFDGADFARLLLPKVISAKASGALPRSQLFRWLQIARRSVSEDVFAGLASTKASDAVDDAFGKWAIRAGAGKTKHQDIELLGSSKRSALDIWLLTQLWDYVDPFAEFQPEQAVA